MNRRICHIVTVLLLALLLASCRQQAEIIPRNTMVDIYADMALLDARISTDRAVKKIADTSRVYAAVFQSYGYTEQDFLTSQQEYLKDAGRYVKMLKKANIKMDKIKKELMAEKRLKDELVMKARSVERFAPYRIYLMDTLDLADTAFFDFDFQKGRDTSFYGPAMVVWADTVGLAAKADTLALPKLESPDSSMLDSLAKNSSSFPLVRKERKAPTGEIAPSGAKDVPPTRPQLKEKAPSGSKDVPPVRPQLKDKAPSGSKDVPPVRPQLKEKASIKMAPKARREKKEEMNITQDAQIR